MTKRLTKKSGSIAAGILIILALIFAIIFLIKLSPKKNPLVRVYPRVDPSQNIQIFGKNTPEYIDLSKYKTDQGQIKKVDTTIKPSPDKNYKYANTTNNFQTYFGNDIKIQKGNASVTFQIVTKLLINDQDQTANLNFNNSLSVNMADGQKNRIRYTKIFQKDSGFIDAAYNIYNDKLSEEIILNQYLGTPQISQKLKLTNTYAKQESDRINFYGKDTNKIIWFIPPPRMYEQNNKNNTNSNLHLELVCVDSSIKSIENCSEIILTKIIDEAGKKWLSDPKRQYPIVIDPDFQIDNADTAANWVSSDTTNFTVSQETTIKQEGTGSVKIVGVATTGFWGISGSPDAGCSIGTTSAASVYSTCSTGAVCQTECFTYGGVCDGGCNYRSACVSSETMYSGCSDSPCTLTGAATKWFFNCSGGCTSGDACYKSGGGGNSTLWYRGCGTCYGGYPLDNTPLACSYRAPLYNYSASGTLNTFSGSGSCSGAGTPPCFKGASPVTGYTGSGGSCGSSCPSNGYYNSFTSCTWTTNSALNDTATITKGATNLSNSKEIKFWVRSTRTGSFMRFQMGEAASTEQTYAFTISSANTWEQKTWDITGIAAGSRDAITKLAFQNTDASSGFTFYFDDAQAIAAAPNTPSVCVIDESSTDTYLIPKWIDSSSDENGFQLEKSTDGSAFSFLTNLAAGITAYQDNSVSTSHTYTYRIRSYKTGVGSTDFSDYCTHPTLNLSTGSFKFEGLKMEGLKIN